METESEKLKRRIDNNREEINNILSKNWPVELLYIRIKMLSAQNGAYIQKLNNLK